jgi:hypothetical protein
MAMATLSLSLSGSYFLDDVLSRLRHDRPQSAIPRPRMVAYPEPTPVPVSGLREAITVKVASEPDEWEQVFQLVSANYQERGYEAVSGKPFRFTQYHALPDTTIFVAKRGKTVVATFSLVPDNRLLGLPMESIYGAEIADLRRQGRRMAEVTSLAVADLSQREFLQVFTTLIKVLQQYHVSRGGDSWVITVNPRHRNFYCKVLGFQPLGACKNYAAVGDAPAEAYLLDRDLMRTNAPRSYEFSFGQWLPSSVLTGVSLPRPFIRYFGSASSQTDEGLIAQILSTVAFASPRSW